MNQSKITQFATLLPQYYHPGAERGRKPSPFTTELNGDTRYPTCRAAYIKRLHHFKLLTAVDHGYPCLDPIAETKRHIGSIRRTLWLYLHDCLPDFPAKHAGLDDLLATHNANLLTQGIEKIILQRLQQKTIGDREFAAIVLNDEHLMDFAQRWFKREKGNRSI
jgi:hypothetical protein